MSRHRNFNDKDEFVVLFTVDTHEFRSDQLHPELRCLLANKNRKDVRNAEKKGTGEVITTSSLSFCISHFHAYKRHGAAANISSRVLPVERTFQEEGSPFEYHRPECFKAGRVSHV